MNEMEVRNPEKQSWRNKDPDTPAMFDVASKWRPPSSLQRRLFRYFRKFPDLILSHFEIRKKEKRNGECKIFGSKISVNFMSLFWTAKYQIFWITEIKVWAISSVNTEAQTEPILKPRLGQYWSPDWANTEAQTEPILKPRLNQYWSPDWTNTEAQTEPILKPRLNQYWSPDWANTEAQTEPILKPRLN